MKNGLGLQQLQTFHSVSYFSDCEEQLRADNYEEENDFVFEVKEVVVGNVQVLYGFKVRLCYKHNKQMTSKLRAS